MDSPENVLAVPADMGTYTALPNDRYLPYHSGPHPNYDADIARMLNERLGGAARMPDEEVAAVLRGIEAEAFAMLIQGWQINLFHPRIN